MKHLICSLLVSLLLIPLAWSQTRAIRPVKLQIPSGKSVDLYQGSYALVIGVSDYQDNAWVDLDSVGADVEAVRETLEDQGFVVETLMNPTKNRLLNGITDFIGTHGYEQENRLLFYYAGHGHTQERNGRKFGYLVPIDAPNPFENEKVFYRKSLKMEQIHSWAKQIESKHALFVFDSCFSGSVLQSRAVSVPEDISYLTAKPVRQFISAGSANQTVPAVSVFRPLFIRGINGKADYDKDGYVTGDELGRYLQKQVPYYETGQTPQYGKIRDPYLDEGNFVFEVGNRGKIEPKIVTLYINADDWFNDLMSNPQKWEISKKSDNVIVYRGEVKNGLPNGQGTLTLSVTIKYVGEFKDGKRNGQGTFTLPDGEKYVGQYKDDKMHGQGTYTFPSGEKYVGEFKDGLFNGQGTFTFADGRVKSGLWKDGDFLGENQSESKTVTLYISSYNWEYFSKPIPANWETSRNLESDHVYIGEVSNGLPKGRGTLTFSNGAKYIGEFKDGQFSGQGTHTFSDSAKYIGEFKDNQFNGQGTYTWPDGTKYIGYWLNGLKNGQGTQTFPDGQVKNGLWIFGKFSEKKPVQTEQLKSGAMTLYISKDDWLSGMESSPASWKTQNNLESDFAYVGEVKNGVPNGQGSWASLDGHKYFGEWKDSKWHGQGTLTSPDGTKYVGEFQNGLEHGQGTWTKSDGTKYVGEWEYGERNGQGTYTYPDETKYVGSFRDNRFHGKGTFTWPEGRWWLNETNEIEKKGFWRNGEFLGSQ